MASIKINNWEKFQHYKDRRPIWIKLLIEIIEEFDANGEPKKFFVLPDSAKLSFVLLACLRANYNGKIPYPSDKWLRKRLGIKKLMLQPLVDTGFITIDSDTVSTPYHNDTETSHQSKRESKRKRTEKEKHLSFVFLSKEEHKKLVQRFGEKATSKLIDDLDYYISNNKKGKDPYTEHYRTMCRWAIRDKIPELFQIDKKAEAVALHKKCREKLAEYGPWIKEASEEKLIPWYKKNVHLRWVVEELRPDIAAKAKRKESQ